MPKSPFPQCSEGAGLGDFFREEETKTTCPACEGTGKDRCATCRGTGVKSLEPAGHSQYRRIACFSCRGKGVFGDCKLCRGTKMINASAASGWRMKAVQLPGNG